jgi:hypothetical protein
MAIQKCEWPFFCFEFKEIWGRVRKSVLVEVAASLALDKNGKD